MVVPVQTAHILGTPLVFIPSLPRQIFDGPVEHQVGLARLDQPPSPRLLEWEVWVLSIPKVARFMP